VRGDFLGRGLRFPFGFEGTGRIATTAGEDNIRQSISLILATRPGERQMLPAFGCRVHELLFAPNTAATAVLVSEHVRSALERWEPRIEVTGVVATPDARGTIQVEVRYRLRATRTDGSLSVVLSGA
jgi:phage baseplate assembly protein W